MNDTAPMLSTAALLMRDVLPLSEWRITEKTTEKQHFPVGAQQIGGLASIEAKRKKREADFAPHIQTIARMRKNGASFAAIGKKLKKSKGRIMLYYRQNEHLFKDA